MTTIAFNDNTMAADSCINGVYMDQLSADKVYLLDGYLIGCAGEMTAIKRFISYVEGGFRSHDIPKKITGDFEALVYSMTEQQLFYYDSSYISLETGVPAAIGSGQMFAMGAMLAGASATDAVDISKKLDPYTNGDIKTYKIEEGELEDATPERIAALEARLENILKHSDVDVKHGKKNKKKNKKKKYGRNSRQA